MAKSHLFHLEESSLQDSTDGGKRIRALKSNFPVLQGMALYRLQLKSHAVREPHWHPNADELGYCLDGQVLVSIYGNHNLREKFLVNSGDCFFIPSGALHDIENIGDTPADLIVQFSNEEPEDFGLSGVFGMFSDAVLGNTWGVSSELFASLKRSTKDVVMTMQKEVSEVSAEERYSSLYHLELESSAPLLSNEGGLVRVARNDRWPILTRQALYSLQLTGLGMREPHWHPETAELGFIKKGRGRMSILSPGGTVDTYEINPGDIYFIPKAYPHHIENLTNDSLEILIFFDQSMPQDIGFTASVKSYSDEVLSSVLGGSSELFCSLPRYYSDLLIVNKVNPLD